MRGGGDDVTLLSDMRDNLPIHTYEDDIRFQIIKGDNRRSSFLSSDLQILNKNNYQQKLINKTERIASADFRRQQSDLMAKFDRLQCRREELGMDQFITTPSPRQESRVAAGKSSAALSFVSRTSHTRLRRHSMPISVGKLLQEDIQPSVTTTWTSDQEIKLGFGARTDTDGVGGETGGGKTEVTMSKCDTVDPICRPISTPPLPTSSLARFHRRGTVHNIGGFQDRRASLCFQEARRRSHDIQAETSKYALERLKRIMAECQQEDQQESQQESQQEDM